jgi:hypothetical protein
MQSIVTPLRPIVTADTREIKIGLLASWLKVADLTRAYAIVGTSLVEGPDLVQGQSIVITNADLFSYMDESTYVMQFEYDRRLQEPQGGVSYAIGDFLLDNITKRFTPNYDDTIGTAVQARRPIKATISMKADAAYRGVQVIVGLTSDVPRESKSGRTTEVQVYDYITFIENSNLAAAIYEDMRSDEIIESILGDLGFGTSQYSLDTGINTIPFAWFDKDKKAGKRIRELCEAEEAHFYQDENGIIRFENRNHYANFPHQTVQHTIDSGDIMSDENDESTKIINRAIVLAKPRTVDVAAAEIWRHSQTELLTPGQTRTIWASFFDAESGESVLPINEITAPGSGTDYTANTLEDGSGTDRTASLGITVTNFVESAKIDIVNNHGSDSIYVTLLKLRGKAARVTKAIQAISEDADSINKFEAQEYVVRNNLIQTPSIAQSIADNLKNRYSQPLGRRIIRIPGIPHLQLKDLVKVTNPRPENLVPNPTFEVGTTGWEIEETGTGEATLTQARDVPIPDGFYVGKVTMDSF